MQPGIQKGMENYWISQGEASLKRSRLGSTMYKDREILLYAIMKNFKFNVGKVIQHSILEEDVGRSLTHPSLITRFVEKRVL